MERLCKHLITAFDNRQRIQINACDNPDCSHCGNLVSELVCKPCPQREEPDETVLKIVETMPETFEAKTQPERSGEEREKLYTQYCSKCHHLCRVTKRCRGCECNPILPVDELIHYEGFHCPLGFW